MSANGHEADWINDDRVQWREAAGDFSLPRDVVCVSLSLADAPARIVRHKAAGLRVIALASRAQTEARVAALAAGVDEFLTTGPIDGAELRGRVTLLRDGKALPREMELDAARQILQLPEGTHDLTERECALLEMLIGANGGFVTHEALLVAAWGPNASERREYLRVAIRKLRQRIEPDPPRCRATC